jgi:hypothetical protein
MLLPEAAKTISEKILADIADGKNHVLTEINVAIKEKVADAPFYIEPYPSGAYYVDAEVVSANVDSIELVEIIPLNYDQSNKTIKIKFIFKVYGRVEGQFTFSVYDREDRHHYPIGDSNESRDQEWECEAFTQFSYEDGAWTLDDLSINLNVEVVEFIDIEPDFGQE